MKIHENLKNEEKTQNHKPGEGGEVVGNYIYLALLVHLTMYAKSFSGTPCVRIKAVVFFFLNKHGWSVMIYGFHGNQQWDSQKSG